MDIRKTTKYNINSIISSNQNLLTKVNSLYGRLSSMGLKTDKYTFEYDDLVGSYEDLLKDIESTKNKLNDVKKELSLDKDTVDFLLSDKNNINISITPNELSAPIPVFNRRSKYYEIKYDSYKHKRIMLNVNYNERNIKAEVMPAGTRYYEPIEAPGISTGIPLKGNEFQVKFSLRNSRDVSIRYVYTLVDISKDKKKREQENEKRREEQKKRDLQRQSEIRRSREQQSLQRRQLPSQPERLQLPEQPDRRQLPEQREMRDGSTQRETPGEMTDNIDKSISETSSPKQEVLSDESDKEESDKESSENISDENESSSDKESSDKESSDKESALLL